MFTSLVYAQHIGIPYLSDELPRTSLLIEKARNIRVEQFVPLPGFTMPSNAPANIDSNVYIKVWADQTVYDPLGSGVILICSNIPFIATANHVVSPDGAVHFRIPQKSGKDARHQPHLDNATGWIRDTNNDVAVAALGIQENTDDIKAIPIDSMLADYDEVSIGDEVFILGYPSSVVQSQDPTVHYLRNGVVASKHSSPRIIIDAFLFPGNSGGPVYWKQTSGIKFNGIITGPEIPGRLSKLVGIVSETLQYREEAKSPQTGRTRVIFEENSGLAVVISSTVIKQLMARPEVISFIDNIYKNASQQAGSAYPPQGVGSPDP